MNVRGPGTQEQVSSEEGSRKQGTTKQKSRGQSILVKESGDSGTINSDRNLGEQDRIGTGRGIGQRSRQHGAALLAGKGVWCQRDSTSSNQHRDRRLQKTWK